MKIGAIGTSWITQSFLDSSAYADGVSVTAVYSRSAEKALRFSEKNGIPQAYSSLGEMLASPTIDAVYIASPNACHYEQAKACLQAGKHVLCEKPAAVTSAQLQELYTLAQEKGRIFLEAMKSMHSDGLPIVRQAIREIGQIRTASLDFSQLSSKYPSYKRGEKPNIFNPELCTGALMDLGVYCVYLALELFAEPCQVLSHADFLSTGADGSGTLIFVYSDKTVTITYSKTANSFSESRILGDEGAVGIQSVSQLTGIKKYKNDGSVQLLYPNPGEHLVMAKEIEAFKKFADGKNMPFYAYCQEISLSACRLMEKIRKENSFGF